MLSPLESEALLLSIKVATWAVACSLPFAVAAAWLLARYRFPGKSLIDGIIHLPLVLPPVVVGLVVYLLLSRAGPLGILGLLFTPTAMIVAQFILIAPIIAALTRQLMEDVWQDYAEQLRSLGYVD